jgi:hypothetical protein
MDVTTFLKALADDDVSVIEKYPVHILHMLGQKTIRHRETCTAKTKEERTFIFNLRKELNKQYGKYKRFDKSVVRDTSHLSLVLSKKIIPNVVMWLHVNGIGIDYYFMIDNAGQSIAEYENILNAFPGKTSDILDYIVESTIGKGDNVDILSWCIDKGHVVDIHILNGHVLDNSEQCVKFLIDYFLRNGGIYYWWTVECLLLRGKIELVKTILSRMNISFKTYLPLRSDIGIQRRFFEMEPFLHRLHYTHVISNEMKKDVLQFVKDNQ